MVSKEEPEDFMAAAVEPTSVDTAAAAIAELLPGYVRNAFPKTPSVATGLLQADPGPL